MRIDVYFDLICPWCWIGKRHLSEALAQWESAAPGQSPCVVWHGAPLWPDLPLEGVPYRAFYLQRLGSEQAIRARQQQVQTAAHHAGLAIRFDAMQVMPHTGRAHQLLRWIGDQHPSLHDRLMDALFRAHFVEGRHLGEVATLADIAQACGVDRQHAQDLLQNTTSEPSGSAAPSSGVPTFDFGAGLVVAGAHPPPVLLRALQMAHGRTRTALKELG